MSISLAEFARTRENVVLFWSGTGNSEGTYEAMGIPGDTSSISFDTNLMGEVDASGVWFWNEKETPLVCRGNPISKIQAYVNERKWFELTEE